MKAKRTIAIVAFWFLLAALAGGCATAPAPAPGTVSSPIPGREAEPVRPKPTASESGGPNVPVPPPATTPKAVGTTASGGTITQTGPSVAPRDSTPSADARAVLKTIPDPVSGSAEPAPSGGEAPASVAPASVAPAPHAAVAMDIAGASPDTLAVEVPTPELTQPLGERPGGHAVTDSATVGGPPATAASPSPPGGPSAPAPPDSCWRVQVVAVPEASRAAALRDAAQSQLWTTMVIETEKKLHKVRTKDCLPAAAAERLKQRAIAAGFQGAFRFLPPK